MKFMTIRPQVPLCDREQEAKLEAKRRSLFDAPYRPRHVLVEHWPSPPGEHFFGMPLMKLVKK